MNGNATVSGWSLSVPVRGAGRGQRVAGLVLGLAFTFLLFLGIAHYEKGAPKAPPPELDDLHMASVVLEPPPLPVKQSEMVPEIVPMAGFEYSPAESEVKIAVSPPELAAILPEDMSKAPVASTQIGWLQTDFKPKLGFLFDPQHIYQKSDVDRIPALLERPDPAVPSRMMEGNPLLRVTIIFIVEPDGTVDHIRLTKSSGIPDFDALMTQSVKEWVFSPALKGGKKVRCLMEQPISVRQSSGSRFGV